MSFLNFFKKRKDQPIEDVLDKMCNNMVIIPPGSCLMGSNSGEDDERPIHNILIDGFQLGKYEVTQKEWFDIMNTKPWLDLRYLMEGDNFPAVNVSWYDVREFIKKLNRCANKKFRLPTEAEWEYACRAGSTSKFYHGSFKLNLHKYAWYYDNAFKNGEMYAHEVGRKKPNKWDLYDMLGNVYEWCSDWYRRNFYHKSPVNNPKGPRFGKGKIVRGGDWSRTDYFLRVSSRRYYSPHSKDSYIGFRLACELNDQHEKTVPFDDI